MKKVYIVNWAAARQDDDGNSSAYSGVHGVYASKDDAKKGLVECKDDFYNEIVNNPDYDVDEFDSAIKTTHVYGSVKDEYFEIDSNVYFSEQTYIRISEQEIIE